MLRRCRSRSSSRRGRKSLEIIRGYCVGLKASFAPVVYPEEVVVASDDDLWIVKLIAKMSPMAKTTSFVVVMAVAAIMALVMVGCSITSTSESPPSAATVAPDVSDPTATGTQLVDRFLSTLKGSTTDTAALSAILAPDFQLVRADGTRANKDSYLADPAEVFNYEIKNLRAVADTFGGAATLTVSFDVAIDEVINGQSITTTSPRLGAFVWSDGEWLLVSWANFNPTS